MEICRLWGTISSSPCCVGLFHIFVSTYDEEFPNSESCKYLGRISFKKCRKEAGEMPFNEKKTWWEKYWVGSASSRCSWSWSAVLCTAIFPRAHAPSPACNPACWLLEHIRNRQHWNAKGCCSFPYSFVLTNVFWTLQHLRPWTGQVHTPSFETGLN